MIANEYSSDEWQELVSGQGGSIYCVERLKKSMKSGIPDRLRPAIWHFLTKSQTLPSLYHKLQGTADPVVAENIRKDLARTFLNSTQFNQDSLFNILQAYSLFDIEIGYCQGMSFVAGIFLLVMQEEEPAFWAFVFIMHTRGWREMYLNGTPKLNLLLEDLQVQVRNQLPAVYKKFKNNEVDMIMFSQHFVTLLGYKVKRRFTIRIMDVLLSHEEEILTRILFKMLKFKEKKILTLEHNYLFRYLLDHLISECYEEYHITTFFA